MMTYRAKETIFMEKHTTPSARAAECIAAWHDTGKDTDIQGWYTGTYKDPDEKSFPVSRPYIFMNAALEKDLKPIQDADDL